MNATDRCRILLAVIVMAGIVLSPALAQENEGDTCPPFVELALSELADGCDNMDRNSACYGYNRVGATFIEEVDDDFFSEPSDRAKLENMVNITTTPFDEEMELWGVAVLSLQANVPNTMPGQAVKFILLGETDLTNAVAPENTFEAVDPITITTNNRVNLRSAPSLNANVLLVSESGMELNADGVSPDGEWLRIFHQKSNMWVNLGVVNAGDISTLPQIGDETFTPMQAFYFTTGVGEPKCNGAPDMLVVQGPDEVLVDLNVNGADITIGSTAVLRNGAASISEIISNYDLPAHIRSWLQGFGENSEQLCRLVQISVISGEVGLNEGQFILPMGNSAFTVSCQMGDLEEIGDEFFSSDWFGAHPFSDDDFFFFAFLEGIPAAILNYPIVLPDESAPLDTDGDGILNDDDNCPNTYNVNQWDYDNDGYGNVCDDDDDNDGWYDYQDNCQFAKNADQQDSDDDGVGDACDGTPNGDADFDEVDDLADNCVNTYNPDQTDSDNDGQGDACEPPPPPPPVVVVDTDGDGFPDTVDDCDTKPGTSTLNLTGCPDSNADGNADSDMQIVSSVDVPVPILGQTVTLTLTMTNLGPNDVTGVVMGTAEGSTYCPAGLTCSSPDPYVVGASAGSSPPQALLVGQSFTYTRVYVAGINFPNYCYAYLGGNVSGSSLPDDNPSNDFAGAISFTYACPP
jgi:hypothetical protein